MTLSAQKMVWDECVWYSVCFCVCVLSHCATGFSHGAASSACWDLKPGHVGAQHTHHTHTHTAFTLHPRQMEYLPQRSLTVTLHSVRPFMGFMLQARSLQDDSVVGQFLRPPPGTQRMRCSREGDTLTHADKQLKRNMSFTWRAPDQPSGDVRFYITVVQSYFVYWSRIQSPVVHDGTRRFLRMMNSKGGVTRSSQNKVQTANLSILSSVTHPPPTAAHIKPATLPITSAYSVLDGTQANLFTHHIMPQKLNTMHSASLRMTHSSTHELTNAHNFPSITGSMQSTVNSKLHTIQTFRKEETQTTEPTTPLRKHNYSNYKMTQNVQSHIHSQATKYSLSEHAHTKHLLTPDPFLQYTHPSIKLPKTQPYASLIPSISPVLDPSPAPRLSLIESLTPPAPPSQPAPLTPYHHPNQSGPPAPPGIFRPPATEGGRPRGGMHKQRVSELGLLLGCSVGLGVVLTLALRCLHRRWCRKHSEVCLSERSRRWEDDNDIIQVQEYGGNGGGGELVQVRKIRQNSLLLLQTEYNVITPPGN